MTPGRKPIEYLAVVAKLAFGVAVFVTTVGSWAYLKPVVVNHMALPDSVSDRSSNACALWFVGSSSIEKWQTLQRDIPGWQIHNRGIGGARLAQIEARTAQTTSTVKPAGIVLYAGENDIADGTPGPDAARKMMGLAGTIVQQWPRVPIFIVALKPSPHRWQTRPEQLRYNAVIDRFAQHRRDVVFVPAGAPLLRDGKPDPSLFVDGVHLNERGYALWSRDIRRGIEGMMPRDRVAACAPPTGPDRTPLHRTPLR